MKKKNRVILHRWHDFALKSWVWESPVGVFKSPESITICPWLFKHYHISVGWNNTSGRAVFMVACTCNKIFTFSRSNSKPVTHAWVRVAYPKRYILPPKSKGFFFFNLFFSAKKSYMQEYILHYGRDILMCPRPLATRSFTEVQVAEFLWNFLFAF